LDEVLAWLAEISQLAEQLLDGQYGTLSTQQVRFLQNIHRLAHEDLPNSSKELIPLLIDYTPYEAITQIAIDWRSPLSVIASSCELMEMGRVGNLMAEQLLAVQKIRALTEKMRIGIQ